MTKAALPGLTGGAASLFFGELYVTRQTMDT